MLEQVSLPEFDEFSEWVRDVLNHLYDSAYLQTHPLGDTLVDDTTDVRHRSQRLRRVILDAIRTMFPEGQVSAQSPDWRNYKVLELRYIQGMNWAEVMDKLAIGKTLYYNSHALAVEALTQALWEIAQQQTKQAAPSPDAADKSRAEIAQLDLEHLVAQASWEKIEAISILEDLKTVIVPLAQSKRVELTFDLNHRITVLRADRVMLRQTMLNVITYALDLGVGARVSIHTFATGNEANIAIEAWPQADSTPLSGPSRQGLGLGICEEMMRQMGGILYLKTSGDEYWRARLGWPTAVSPDLLVVDDNEGLVELFKRYLAGTTWQITGAKDGQEARQMLAQSRPGVIILDVMMPGEDGWELLMALKDDDRYRDIPVIICSVLNEPQLARNLGAATYLAKPAKPESLLQLLKPWRQVGATLEPAT